MYDEQIVRVYAFVVGSLQNGKPNVQKLQKIVQLLKFIHYLSDRKNWNWVMSLCGYSAQWCSYLSSELRLHDRKVYQIGR